MLLAKFVTSEWTSGLLPGDGIWPGDGILPGDGDKVPASLDLFLVHPLSGLAAGKAYHMIIFHPDTLFNRRALKLIDGLEANLPQQNFLFQGVFLYAPVGMAIAALDGQRLDVNPAFCELVGYSGEELLRMTFQDIIHPDDLSADLTFVEQLLAGEIFSYKMEKRYFHKQGHR